MQSQSITIKIPCNVLVPGSDSIRVDEELTLEVAVLSCGMKKWSVRHSRYAELPLTGQLVVSRCQIAIFKMVDDASIYFNVVNFAAAAQIFLVLTYSFINCHQRDPSSVGLPSIHISPK